MRCRKSVLWRLLTPEGFSYGKRGGTLSSKVDRVMSVCQRKLVVGTLSGENWKFSGKTASIQGWLAT